MPLKIPPGQILKATPIAEGPLNTVNSDLGEVFDEVRCSHTILYIKADVNFHFSKRIR